MHPFALSRADDPATAIAAHAQDPQLAFIAGGTDLIGLMKDRAQLPERLLDINGLPDMARIEALPDGGLRIGARQDADRKSTRLNSSHLVISYAVFCLKKKKKK